MDDKLNKEEVWNKCLFFIKNRIQETLKLEKVDYRVHLLG